MCWIWRRATSSDSSISEFPCTCRRMICKRIREGRQGVAQLVGQHGQELVLALTGLLQFLGLAAGAASPFAFDR